MKHVRGAKRLAACVLVGALWATVPAGAQEADRPIIARPGSVEIVTEPAPDIYLARQVYLEQRVKRARAALIATSVSFGLGVGLLAGGASQCETVDQLGGDRTTCSDAGDVLVGVGSSLMIGGFVGAIVSGIMLGSRKGRLRELRRMRAVPYAHGTVRWSPLHNAFVF